MRIAWLPLLSAVLVAPAVPADVPSTPGEDRPPLNRTVPDPTTNDTGASAQPSTAELIALLAHPDALVRTRAHDTLLRYLATETGAPEFADRLTRFHKHAPHACKADHEAQTLYILGLFAELEDISSILIAQCLQSSHPRVRAAALEAAHFADNRIDGIILAYDPDPATLASYRIALRNLGTEEAAARLAALPGGR